MVGGKVVENTYENSRMGNLMVKEHSLLEKVNGKETSILENSRMEKGTVKKHSLHLMGTFMRENGRMV